MARLGLGRGGPRDLAALRDTLAETALLRELLGSVPLPALLERARIQEAMGRREAAIGDFQRALDLNPQSEDARNGLARLRGQRS
jgi:DNA mismatch repair protein MutS